MGSIERGAALDARVAVLGGVIVAFAACGSDEGAAPADPYLRLFETETTATQTTDPLGVWTTPEAQETVRIELRDAELVVAKRCRPDDGSSLLYVGVTLPIALHASEIDIKEGRGMRADGSTGRVCAITIPTAKVPFRLSNASLEVSLEGPPATFLKVADGTTALR